MSDPRNERRKEPDHPGMMGDETQEQSLGRRGHAAARILEEEVDRAFGGELGDDAYDDAEYDDADLEGPHPEFWLGFAWGAASVAVATWLLRRPR